MEYMECMNMVMKSSVDSGMLHFSDLRSLTNVIFEEPVNGNYSHTFTLICKTQLGIIRIENNVKQYLKDQNPGKKKKKMPIDIQIGPEEYKNKLMKKDILKMFPCCKVK